MKLLAQDQSIQEIFGEVSPPPGMNIGPGDPVEGLGSLIGWGLNIFIILDGLFMLVYLLWGAFDWISSSGDKEKVNKAQSKITNALIGMILIFAILAGFNLLAGEMLGIVENTADGFRLKIPTLR
jgi:hypothetical protein